MPSSSDAVLVLTRREVWAYRVAFFSMGVFTLLGLYVLFFPTEFLIAVYSVMLLVTLTSGVVSGMVTMVA